MPSIFYLDEMSFTEREAALPEYSWHSSARFGQVTGSKRLVFDMRSLDPGKFSFPYHFHRNAEELFFIISGECTMRHEGGFEKLRAGALVHCEDGPAGAHQIYNHGTAPCVYLDIRTFDGVDVTEYPDSGKIGILPALEIFRRQDAKDYLHDEENVWRHWPEDIVGRRDGQG